MNSIRFKLFFSYLIVLVLVIVVVVAAIPLTAPAAYNRYMGMSDTHALNAEGTPMMGPGMGRGLRGGEEQFINFRASLFESLGYASLAAIGVAALASLFLSRALVSPLKAMTSASQRIAQGHYDERVRVDGRDELAQLAGSFNEMAAQLEQTEAMRRRLIGDVSHELRTPLTTIKGSMEGLVDGVLPATPETFEQISLEAERLERLVNDLQELSRVEARAYTLNLTPVAPAELARAAGRRLEQQFAAKGVTLTSDVPASLPQVNADADRALQVFTNLLNNALHYTPTGGQVSIYAQELRNEVQFSVRDTGAGMPTEHIQRIFDRFYRIDPSRSRQAGGSGIGLTIAKYIVEAHGGRIWAESPGKEQGSVFHFTLPVRN